MIWLAWRQHRKQALSTLAGLAVLAAVIVPTGLAIRGRFNDLGLPGCVRQASRSDSCVQAFNQFNGEYDTVLLVGILFLVLPLLVGMFWGAPLVAREVEQGTHRLVWTQGISRWRWALAKFGFVGAVVLAASSAYGLGMSWWLDPLLAGGGRSGFSQLFFDMQGVVPIGYTLFAVALGVFAGTMWPRMLPAMAVTLIGFAALRVLVTVFARPRFASATEATFALTANPDQDLPSEETLPGAWIIAVGIRDAAGAMVAPGTQVLCPSDPALPGAQTCTSQFGAGAYNWLLYQPADRFWPFQAAETAIYLGLAALLLVLAAWRLRRIA